MIKWCLSVSFRDNSKGLLNARVTFDEIYLQSIKDFLIIYAYLMFCKYFRKIISSWKNCHFQLELILYVVIGENSESSFLNFFQKSYHDDVLHDFILPVNIGENISTCVIMHCIVGKKKRTSKEKTTGVKFKIQLWEIRK